MATYQAIINIETGAVVEVHPFNGQGLFKDGHRIRLVDADSISEAAAMAAEPEPQPDSKKLKDMADERKRRAKELQDGILEDAAIENEARSLKNFADFMKLPEHKRWKIVFTLLQVRNKK